MMVQRVTTNTSITWSSLRIQEHNVCHLTDHISILNSAMWSSPIPLLYSAILLSLQHWARRPSITVLTSLAFTTLWGHCLHYRLATDLLQTCFSCSSKVDHGLMISLKPVWTFLYNQTTLLIDSQQMISNRIFQVNNKNVGIFHVKIYLAIIFKLF